MKYVHELCAPQDPRSQEHLEMDSFTCACSACTLPASVSDPRQDSLKADLNLSMRWQRQLAAASDDLKKPVRRCDEIRMRHVRRVWATSA